jgi:hypothetical protein
MTLLRTELEFTLPCGFLDDTGSLHRDGVMRRATGADEIHPLKDPRVVNNPSYLVVIVLARVITRLGDLDGVNPGVIERLFATDLEYLQNLYNELNRLEPEKPFVICPSCDHEFQPLGSGLGG